MKRGIFRRLLIIFLALIALFCQPNPADSGQTNVVKINGAVPLGATRQQVLKTMGKPDSPLTGDFFYTRDHSEVVVAFSDKTGRVESVIVRGSDTKYSIGGVKIGDLKSKVKQVFGSPEKLHSYTKAGVDCWLYPSKCVNFSFNGDKVTSFSVSSFQIGK